MNDTKTMRIELRTLCGLTKSMDIGRGQYEVKLPLRESISAMTATEATNVCEPYEPQCRTFRLSPLENTAGEPVFLEVAES